MVPVFVCIRVQISSRRLRPLQRETLLPIVPRRGDRLFALSSPALALWGVPFLDDGVEVAAIELELGGSTVVVWLTPDRETWKDVGVGKLWPSKEAMLAECYAGFRPYDDDVPVSQLREKSGQSEGQP